MGYIKLLSKAFVKQVELISIVSFSVYKMLSYKLKSWLVG